MQQDDFLGRKTRRGRFDCIELFARFVDLARRAERSAETQRRTEALRIVGGVGGRDTQGPLGFERETAIEQCIGKRPARADFLASRLGPIEIRAQCSEI
jgi:hypothetical protein